MAEDCTVVRFSADPSTARIENLKQNDSTDKITESNQTFGVFYVICIALSIITYVLDLVLACLLLYFYSIHGQGVPFGLTLTFVLVPALFMTAFSLRWIRSKSSSAPDEPPTTDAQRCKIPRSDSSPLRVELVTPTPSTSTELKNCSRYIVDHDDPSLGKIALWQWIVRIVFLLLQISPLLRYIDTLIYGLKSSIARRMASLDQWQVVYYRRMLDEDTNGALLRLFHCFLHAAPQALIQLMFLVRTISTAKRGHLSAEITEIAMLQLWTVIAALVSIAWSLTSYHRSVRYARDDKEKIPVVGTFIAFCWHLMSAVSRILALSLLAAIYPVWMGVICALHWGMMAMWLALGQHQTAACSNRCEELLLSAALGLAYVLAFISPRDGPTRYVYLAYYLVCFMENTGALVVWCVASNSADNPVLYYGAAGAQVAAFLLAITLMLIYYKYCHPSTSSRSKILEITNPNVSDYDKPEYSKSNARRSCS